MWLLGVVGTAWTIGSAGLFLSQVPRYVGYLPDILTAIMSVFLIARLVALKTWTTIPVAYLLVFLGFVWVCVSGLVLNDVSSLTAVGGIRFFYRSIPFFLLPFAFKYSERDIQLQLTVLFCLLVLQVPVTIWQRFFEFSGYTGDGIGGTFAGTPPLAILCSMAVMFLLAFYIDKRISLARFLILSFLVSLPPSLGEVKAFPIFLVVGGIFILFIRRKEIDRKRLGVLLASGLLLLSMFSGLYSLLYARSDGVGYIEMMFTDPRETYHFRGVEALPITIPIRKRNDILGSNSPAERVGEVRNEEAVTPGRLDNLRMPIQALYPNELTYLILGLGIGNVASDFGSPSAYRVLDSEFFATRVTFSYLIWETGLAGATLFLILFLLLLKECAGVASAGNFTGTVNAGLFGCSGIMLFSLFYINIFFSVAITYPFFYMAGLMVYQAQAISKAGKQQGINTYGMYQSVK